MQFNLISLISTDKHRNRLRIICQRISAQRPTITQDSDLPVFDRVELCQENLYD